MPTDQRQIRLKDREIPFNKQGDPAFETLEDVNRVFEPWEIVKLVNFALYQKLYMREHHRDYNRRERELMRVIRPILKAKGVKLMHATEDEITAALKEAKQQGLIPEEKED